MRGDRIVDRAVSGPGAPAHVFGKMVRNPSDMHIHQRSQEIGQHWVLRSFGHREMEFTIETLADIVVEWKRIRALEYCTNRLDVSGARTLRCEPDDLALKQLSRFPEIANADALCRKQEQGWVVDERQPAEWPYNSAAAVRGTNDV